MIRILIASVLIYLFNNYPSLKVTILDLSNKFYPYRTFTASFLI